MQPNSHRVLRKDNSSIAGVKQKSKLREEKHGTDGQTATSVLSGSSHGKTEVVGDSFDARRNSNGGTMAERLITFSQKVMDSFGCVLFVLTTAISIDIYLALPCVVLIS